MTDTEIRRSSTRLVLWLALIISAAANAATSMLGFTWASVACGAVALVSIVALVREYRRGRHGA